MSLSTLANTKWLLNNSIQFDQQSPFLGANINFVSNSTLYSYLDVTDDHDEEISYGTSPTSTTIVYTSDAWVNSAYRTVYFIDGTDIDDPYVIDWVELSGTQIDVDVEAVNADALDGALKGVAEAIRTKGGTSSGLVFPGGFVTAIENIPTGGGGDAAATGIIAGTISSTYVNSSVTSLRPYAFTQCISLPAISLPGVTSAGSQAFLGCSQLSAVYMPLCSVIAVEMFRGCQLLSSLTMAFSQCTTVASSAFYGCSSLPSLNLPACTLVEMEAFQRCQRLSTINLPLCSSLGVSAFAYCSALTSAILPSCISISSYAFAYCPALTTISLPVCTTIGTHAFLYCSRLRTASLPVCTSIRASTFNSCTALSTVILPLCSSIATSAFVNDASLAYVYAPTLRSAYSGAFQKLYGLDTVILSSCSVIGSACFSSCRKLLSLYLLGSSVCQLSSINAFYSTPISTYTTSTGGVHGSIFVPVSLYATYIASTNWVTYSARFVSLTDAEIAQILIYG